MTAPEEGGPAAGTLTDEPVTGRTEDRRPGRLGSSRRAGRGRGRPPGRGRRGGRARGRGRGRLPGAAALFGPAFVAAVAYVDPGNFATNFAAGAQLGYQLLWVVLLASVAAMPIQYLSAKLGIVTGKTLPQLVGERYRPTARWLLWGQAELVAMATDLAEFVGAAVGLHLLFGVPVAVATPVTACLAFAILALQRKGFRPFELAIAALLFVVFVGFAYQVLRVAPAPAAVAGGLVPRISGGPALVLAAGIVGATAMPHVIYLHSALTARRVPVRRDAERHRVIRFEKIDVLAGLGVAGLVNVAMLAVAAKLFHRLDSGSVTTLAGIHAGLGTLVGGGAALVFAVALLASGISSTGVGTYAGQVVMDGFIRHRIPLLLRRAVTMLPAVVVLLAGVEPMAALVWSQVFLSFGIPFALVPLVRLAGSREVMGRYRTRPGPHLLVCAIAAVIIGLNAGLLGYWLVGSLAA